MRVRDYFREPLKFSELQELREKLQLHPSFWTSAALQGDEDEILAQIEKDPSLLLAPILINNDQAVVAIPAERVIELSAVEDKEIDNLMKGRMHNHSRQFPRFR